MRPVQHPLTLTCAELTRWTTARKDRLLYRAYDSSVSGDPVPAHDCRVAAGTARPCSVGRLGHFGSPLALRWARN